MLKKWKVNKIKINSNHWNLLKKYHYSDYYLGMMMKHCFELTDEFNNLKGIAIYSLPSGKNTAKVYKKTKKENVLELRRLACIDNTPKNTKSYFIAKCNKWIKKNTNYDVIVSYADPYYNHVGTIYKASNFIYIGKQKYKQVKLNWKNKILNERELYRKNKNKEYSNIELRNDYKKGQVKRIYMPKKHMYRIEL